jgi:CMP-N,N'-diacetyllegionaminic acid synthase
LQYLIRPKKLSGSNATTESVIEHTLQLKFGKKYYTKVKNIILLQPTSPLRTIKNIILAKSQFEKNMTLFLVATYQKNLFGPKIKN